MRADPSSPEATPEGTADRRALAALCGRWGHSARCEGCQAQLDALSSAGLRVVDAAEHEGLRAENEALRAAVVALADRVSDLDLGIVVQSHPIVVSTLAAVVDRPPAEDARCPECEGRGWVYGNYDEKFPCGHAWHDAHGQFARPALGGEGEGEKP